LIVKRRPVARNGRPKTVRKTGPALDWEVTSYFRPGFALAKLTLPLPSGQVTCTLGQTAPNALPRGNGERS
jgi:hypothetical protein